MPFFSIIIPTYNSSETILKSINSIIRQDFEDWEILLMDGMSKDNTIELVRSLGESRIRIVSEPDNGVYDAMNKGIVHAKGGWLYFLGSDDELYDNSILKKIYHYSQEGQYDFIYGNAWFVKAQRRYIGEVSKEFLYTEGNICHQAIFYQKPLFERLGNYNLKYKLWADWDFNIRCFSWTNIRIGYCDILIARYNDATGMSATKGHDQDLLPILNVSWRQYLIRDRIVEEFKRKSVSYKLGNALLKPFKLFRKK